MQDERLYFRELLETDADRLFEIYSNSEAMKYRESKAMIVIEDAHEMISRAIKTKQTSYEYRFAIIEKKSEKLIGSIMYQPVANKAIIGYSIDEYFWNNGYGSAVVKIMVNYLKTKDFYYLEAWVKKENLASCKVLEKNNFKQISQTIYPNNKLYQYKITNS